MLFGQRMLNKDSLGSSKLLGKSVNDSNDLKPRMTNYNNL